MNLRGVNREGQLAGLAIMLIGAAFVLARLDDIVNGWRLAIAAVILGVVSLFYLLAIVYGEPTAEQLDQRLTFGSGGQF